MFTGIVETVGTVAEVAPGPAGARIVVTHDLDGELQIGESVSVSGCCVTVTDLGDRRFAADLMGETLRRTALGGLTPGALVNLERAVPADGRFGGHIVQGHVDGVGTVASRTDHDAWTVMAVSVPGHLSPYLVEKGSVTVDGTSLTVMGVDRPGDGAVFEVGLIPHTLAATVLGRRRPGDPVNIEVDVLAKYVERLLAGGATTPYGPTQAARRSP
ncbi:MAG TPA: riboflavin synthase [Euzebyales bacterium]|nr:riboflavin synthase [Euzebyales bacterium]